MPMLIDSHCHLDYLTSAERGFDFDTLMSEAADAGVTHMLTVSVDRQNMPRVLADAARQSNVFASVGIHPGAAHEDALVTEAELAQWSFAPKVVAIGETGLDYHYGADTADLQRESFVRHLRAAADCGLPVIVHTREAREDTLRLLSTHASREHAGVMHCFTESLDMAMAALEMNFMISFSGIISFRNADELRDVVRAVPLERLLVETDSPYLAPVPHRGKPNRPAWVARVAECVAELKGVEVEVVHRQTSENFARLFPRAGLGV